MGFLSSLTLLRTMPSSSGSRHTLAVRASHCTPAVHSHVAIRLEAIRAASATAAGGKDLKERNSSRCLSPPQASSSRCQSTVARR